MRNVVDHHLPAPYSIVGANIDEDNQVHMVFSSFVEGEGDRVFDGKTFAEVFRRAVDELGEVKT